MQTIHKVKTTATKWLRKKKKSNMSKQLEFQDLLNFQNWARQATWKEQPGCEWGIKSLHTQATQSMNTQVFNTFRT